MGTLPDHFEGEDVIITFEKEYTTASPADSTSRTAAIKNVDGKVLSWNIGGGSQPSEDVQAFGGKTFNFSKPREKFTVSFEVVINDADFSFVHMGSGNAAAGIGAMQNKMVKSSDATYRWRVGLYFQESQYHISLGSVVVPSKVQACYRMLFCDVKSITFDREFSSEEYMKGTLSLEFPALDSDGYANFFEEEVTGTTSGKLASCTTSVDNATTGAEGLLRAAKGYMDWNVTTAAWYAGSTTTDVSKRYRYTG